MRKFTYLCFLVITIHTNMSQAVPLLPMTQVYQLENGDTLNEQFLVSSTSFTVFVTGANSEDVVLTLPNGTSINETNSSSYNISWITESNVTNDNTLITIKSDTAVTGTYFIAVQARTDELSGVSVLESPGLKYRAIVGEPSKGIAPNTMVPFSVVLYHEGAPAIGATITVDLIDSTGGVVGHLILKDDGQSPDVSLGDGVYSVLTSFNSADTYQAKITANWNNKQGKVSESIFVSPTYISISGQYSVSTVDLDNDGLFNSVLLTFEELAPRIPGEYSITAEIKDASGNSVIETSLIEQAESPLAVTIGVDELKKLQAQPWQVTTMYIWKGARTLGLWSDLGVLTVDPSKFEREPLIVDGISNDYGVDNDGDGFYERLVVDVSIDTEVAGFYGASADLRSPTKAIIGEAGHSKIYLSAGVNSVSFAFLGASIGGNGEDGPYSLTNFLIYPNFNSTEDLTELVAMVGETNAYACSQIVGCGIGVEAEIIRIANTLCSKLKRRLLNKLNRIKSFENKNPDKAETQLYKLYSQALDWEADGTCLEPENSPVDW
ncbi:choice-of-anchor X domain-containing protein [uncultured Shewanella sp.]|uniref:choice-of-anchor X domain-containing protein n=1 Tax=uncultured Shewanella sp. TaxID=173975 RepID=UPI00262D012B|nr:choice-of-anchor X domain-containing protein [uncultured Shewanella sp.]